MSAALIVYVAVVVTVASAATFSKVDCASVTPSISDNVIVFATAKIFFTLIVNVTVSPSEYL